MQRLLIEFVVRTSLIAAAVALVLYAMRIKTARARHAVWAGVVMAMLLLPVWLEWGPKASLPVLPPESRQTGIAMPAAAGPVTPVVPAALRTSAPPPHFTWNLYTWNWPMSLGGVYLLGAWVLLLRLATGTVWVHRLLGAAVLRDSHLTHESCATPVTVGWFRPSIILPADWPDWPQARLDAILLHELEHARRRDPLFEWIALLNRALFWFHPLAWWLERQISGLAEEACDEAVLAAGHDPGEYSECLLDLAHSVERAGKRVDAAAMAMPGANLPQRIRRMLSESSGAAIPRVSRKRMTCTVAACCLAGAIFAAGTLVRAQSKAQPKTQLGPVFEVASVRPVDAAAGAGAAKQANPASRPQIQIDGASFSWVDSLFGLALRAYGIQGCGLRFHDEATCTQLSGGPAWINEDRFEIQAKIPSGAPSYTLPQFTAGRAPQLQLMLQALLADRFKLKVHHETKQLPLYVLSIAKQGAKLRKPEPGEQPNVVFGDGPLPSDTIQWTVKNTSMPGLADTLVNILGRQVVDRTGLQGSYDFTLNYERDPELPDTATPMAQLSGPGLISALEKQAGLKLESAKGPVDVLVIDHAEKPSAN